MINLYVTSSLILCIFLSHSFPLVQSVVHNRLVLLKSTAKDAALAIHTSSSKVMENEDNDDFAAPSSSMEEYVYKSSQIPIIQTHPDDHYIDEKTSTPKQEHSYESWKLPKDHIVKRTEQQSSPTNAQRSSKSSKSPPSKNLKSAPTPSLKELDSKSLTPQEDDLVGVPLSTITSTQRQESKSSKSPSETPVASRVPHSKKSESPTFLPSGSPEAEYSLAIDSQMSGPLTFSPVNSPVTQPLSPHFQESKMSAPPTLIPTHSLMTHSMTPQKQDSLNSKPPSLFLTDTPVSSKSPPTQESKMSQPPTLFPTHSPKMQSISTKVQDSKISEPPSPFPTGNAKSLNFPPQAQELKVTRPPSQFYTHSEMKQSMSPQVQVSTMEQPSSFPTDNPVPPALSSQAQESKLSESPTVSPSYSPMALSVPLHVQKSALTKPPSPFPLDISVTLPMPSENQDSKLSGSPTFIQESKLTKLPSPFPVDNPGVSSMPPQRLKEQTIHLPSGSPMKRLVPTERLSMTPIHLKTESPVRHPKQSNVNDSKSTKSPSAFLAEVSIPCSNIPSLTSHKTEASTIPSKASTLAPAFPETVAKTTSMRPHSNGTSANVSSAPWSDKMNSQTKCPGIFDKVVQYKEYDLVSFECVIYECKEWPQSTYCNMFEPGSNLAYLGWTAITSCLVTYEKGDQLSDNAVTLSSNNTLNQTEVFNLPSESPSELISVNPTPKVTALNETESQLVLSNPDTLVPTSFPTGRSQSKGSMWYVPQEEEEENNITITLPRIICKISVSSDVMKSFDEEQFLLVAMTNTIYDVLDIHLRKDLYNTAGISLSALSRKYEDEPLTTLLANYTGAVLFSVGGAPAEKELINILLQFFSVDEFTMRLMYPLRSRTSMTNRSILKVNSVLFSLDGGLLIPAGGKTDQSENDVHVSDSTASNSRVQTITASFIIAASALTLLLVLIVIHRRRIEQQDDEDTLQQMSPVKVQSVIVERDEPASESGVVITTMRPTYPSDEPLEVISEVSSLSESPYTDRSSDATDSAPSTPCLGISAPSQRYHEGVRVPYFNYDIDYSVDKWRSKSCMLQTP